MQINVPNGPQERGSATNSSDKSKNIIDSSTASWLATLAAGHRPALRGLTSRRVTLKLG